MPLPRSSSRRPGLAPVAVATAIAVAVSALAGDARADDVSPNGKGIVGGALLGAEVVTIIEALVGVQPGLGLRRRRDRRRRRRRRRRLLHRARQQRRQGADVHAGGRPRARHPGRRAHAERHALPARRGRHGRQRAHGPRRRAGRPRRQHRRRLRTFRLRRRTRLAAPPRCLRPRPRRPHHPPPQSLFDVHRGSFRLGVPVPDVRPVFSVGRAAQYGLRDSRRPELRMPVLHVTF